VVGERVLNAFRFVENPGGGGDLVARRAGGGAS
jgi:hypothetical protein